VCAEIAFDRGNNGEHDWRPVDGTLEIEYRVYDSNDDFYAGANTKQEATRYIESPGDYMTIAYVIEEKIDV
jgi:hypothetical protein